MPSSASEKQKKQKIWQKIILFIGAGAFLSTAAIPIFQSIFSPNPPNNAAEVAPGGQQNNAEQLKQQETGFLAVLEREPENSNALQGLVRTRLELGDLEGAMVPLDQLIELYPEEQVLQDLRNQVTNNLANSTPEATPENTSPTTAPEETESKVTPITPPTSTPENP